jgi:hypothetical protein
MLDGVGVVSVSLIKELLKVVRGRSCLALAAACGSHDVHHARATRLLVVATIVIGRGCALLMMLLAPLPTALGTLPSALEGDVG